MGKLTDMAKQMLPRDKCIVCGTDLRYVSTQHICKVAINLECGHFSECSIIPENESLELVEVVICKICEHKGEYVSSTLIHEILCKIMVDKIDQLENELADTILLNKQNDERGK